MPYILWCINIQILLHYTVTSIPELLSNTSGYCKRLYVEGIYVLRVFVYVSIIEFLKN